jgi:hypothetical protein
MPRFGDRLAGPSAAIARVRFSARDEVARISSVVPSRSAQIIGLMFR